MTACRGVIKKHRLPWSTLASVATDGSPNLTEKNFKLLKRIQEGLKADNPEEVTCVNPL